MMITLTMTTMTTTMMMMMMMTTTTTMTITLMMMTMMMMTTVMTKLSRPSLNSISEEEHGMQRLFPNHRQQVFFSNYLDQDCDDVGSNRDKAKAEDKMVEDIQRIDTRVVDIRTRDMVGTLMVTTTTKKTSLSLRTTFRY